MFKERLKKLRENAGYSQYAFADAFGVAQSTVGNWEAGKQEPNFETVQRLAGFFSVTIDYLLGCTNNPAPYRKIGLEELYQYGNIIPMPKMSKVPLLGTIACGEPILADQNMDRWLKVPEEVHADLALRCKGDSMINARIFNGDIVFVRKQPTVENGQIAAMLIEDEVMLKRVYFYTDRISLRAENPAFPDLNYEGTGLDQICIIGKAVAFVSAVR